MRFWLWLHKWRQRFARLLPALEEKWIQWRWRRRARLGDRPVSDRATPPVPYPLPRWRLRWGQRWTAWRERLAAAATARLEKRARSWQPPSAEAAEKAPSLLGWAALVALPILLILAFMASYFQGLTSEEALDHAQMARHLARGEGFITSVMTPLSLTFQATVTPHPNLSQPPLFALITSLLFRAGGPSDRMAATSSLLGWLLSVWLTFALAHRLFGRGVAILSTALYLVNVQFLREAISGRPTPWATVFLLALWLSLCFREEAALRPSWKRIVLAGLFLGLCVLTDFTWTFPLVFAVLFYLIRACPPQTQGIPALLPDSPQRKQFLSLWGMGLWQRLTGPRPRALFLFLAVFLITIAPWAVHQYAATGNPFFHLGYYDLLSQTRTYPGETVYEFLEPDFSPFTFPSARPRELLRKLAVGLMTLRDTWPGVADPCVTALFLVGLFFPLANLSAQRMRWTLVLLLVLHLGWVSLMNQSATSLLPFAPLVTLLGTASFVHLLTTQVPEIIPAGERFFLPPGVLQRLLGWGLFLLVAYPLVFTQALHFPEPPIKPHPDWETLGQRTKPGEVIMTDIPEILAWYTDRPCLRLCQREGDFQRLEAAVGPIQALYFSSSVQTRNPGEQGEWWFWALQAQAGYRQFVRLPSLAPGSALLLRETKPAGTDARQTEKPQ